MTKTDISRIPVFVANGCTYDDVLPVGWAEGDDVAEMARGHHYDYRAQQWREGNDHAHYSTGAQGAPLMYCGADAVTCYGG